MPATIPPSAQSTSAIVSSNRSGPVRIPAVLAASRGRLIHDSLSDTPLPSSGATGAAADADSIVNASVDFYSVNIRIKGNYYAK